MKQLIAWPALIALVSPAAQADILDFGQGPNPPSLLANVCSSTANGSGIAVACSTGAAISQAYGDVAGVVDITYSDLSPQRAGQSLQWWSNNYNTLYGVAYAGTNPTDSWARIEIKPVAAGTAVSLSSFDLGSYPNTMLPTSINIYEKDTGTLLFSQGTPGNPVNIGNGAVSATSFTPNISSALGLWIEWKANAYNVAIDNIRYSVIRAVAEPANTVLLVFGLFVLGLANRRARQPPWR